MVVYEEAIEIPLVDDDDDDEDEDDDVVEEHDHEQEQEQDDVKDEEDEEEDESNLQVPEISRSATATPLSHRNTADGEDEDEIEDEDGKNQERTRKNPRVDPSKAPPGKKVPLHLLEKRRLGRIKAAEEFARKLKQIGIEKIESTTLPATGLFQPVLLINQKNYSSDYLKKDEQVFALRERKTLRSNTQASSISITPDVTDLKNAESVEVALPADEDIDLSDANTTLVIHPGSRTIKVGLAKNEVPLVVPSCVAIPKSTLRLEVDQRPLNEDQSEEFGALKATIQQNFRERMRYYKRKVPYNAREQVLTFNRASKPQIIEDKNDPAPVEWIGEADRNFYGFEATRCSKEKFLIRYPFDKNGSFNVTSPYYASLQELMNDVISLLEYALSAEGLSINRAQYSQHKVVLVVPDLFEKAHVETFIRCLLTEMQFQAVAIIQESLATCYGAGQSSSTCVVNIGATQTTVACIDEGSVLENSLISLNYGGDDITRLFALLLKQSEFPYNNWDLNSSHGWLCAEELKEKYTTFQDANVTVQLYNYIKRIPGQPLEQYEFKVFDEVMVAPMALFYPEIVSYIHSKDYTKTKENKKLEDQLPPSQDIFTGILNDWRSLSQNECLNGDLYSGNNQDERMLSKLLDLQLNLDELQNEDLLESDKRKNYTPLEKAIIQSITNASISLDVAKMTSFYSNILVVGEGSEIPALDFILTDRINIWRPRLLSVSSFTNFYKKLAKQAKDLRAAAKAQNPEEEDKSPQKIKEMIKEELEEYWEGVEAQNGNEHLLPVSVLPPPRDMDPAVVIWKGASVLAQIKLVEELYLTSTDWDIHGSRILQYKCLFTY